MPQSTKKSEDIIAMIRSRDQDKQRAKFTRMLDRAQTRDYDRKDTHWQLNKIIHLLEEINSKL